MKREIKERIEKVKKGEVPEGYRRHSNYILSEEWKIEALGDLVDYKKGFAFKSSDYRDCGIRIIRISDTTYNSIKNGSPIYISEDDKRKYVEYELLQGDLVVSSVGSRPPMYDSMVGKVIKIPKEVEGALLNQNAVRLRVKTDYDQDFVYNTLKTKRYVYYIESSVRGNANQVSITLNDLFSYSIFMPTKSEQQKISEILSTWDKAIQLKEQLIKQKKEQKRGLMQKLLTGEVRLPGFNGEWKVHKAGKIFKSISNKSHKGIGEVLSVTQENGVILRSNLDIDIKYDKKSLTSYKKVEKGNFIISLRSFQGGIEYSNYKGLVSPAYTVLSNDLMISDGFYKALFKTTDFITLLNSVIYGIRDGKQISYKDFSILKLPYPPVEEQKAIGEILVVVDKEIDLLKQELEALKLQKKGLMQLLLTGIVRVQS